MEIDGKVIIITGATSGIGKATARMLSQAGMKVVLNGRREEVLKSLTSEMPNSTYLAGDLLDPKLPQNLIDHALKTYGRCDAVFNNAGLMVTGSVDEIDVEKVCEMVRVNVEAAFRMAYTAAKYFLSVNYGHLINTSSIAGTKSRDTIGAYSGTKHAIEALSESLRIELAKTGVKISVIEPGPVQTELFDRVSFDPKKAYGVDRILDPSDIARCVKFMLEQPDHVRVQRMLVTPTGQNL